MAQNVHSASDVLATGRARFLSEVAPKAGLSPAEARATFAKAEVTHAAAMMVAGEIHRFASGEPLRAVVNRAAVGA